MTAPQTASTTDTATSSRNPFSLLINVFVGVLIGLAEMVPGVSGGTIALVVGIYERAVRNANALLHSVRVLFSDPKSFGTAIKKIEWSFLISVGVGMIGIILVFSGVMHDFVENHPENARALFLGMVTVSLIVPIRLTDRVDLSNKKIPAAILFLIGAIMLFFITGISSTEKTDPSLILIFFAASIAICALVLPGISGSFILLIMGLYQPVIAAVSNRDLSIMGVFILGAITGLTLFIKLLNYLLHKHHTLTMVFMAGLMLGSLRALWPWQDENSQFLAPYGNIGATIGLIFVGALIAGEVMLLERFTDSGTQNTNSSTTPQHD
ncbi:predicted membrane protein [Corynebacterium kutscheri]|uniref:DUF368 domain-containing protein n=1 Tax=Corynebacterium kutscheri TaxID=35755 RepID=UPI000F6CEF44|nr:DUF368 domain-containing protein [Corynebacterium kutscheri]VEH79467.1 predicted membrane protein [Corynebacterium kutscheri]